MLVEDFHESSFFGFVAKGGGETHDCAVKASIGFDVCDAHPLQAVVIDTVQFLSNDLAQENVKSRATLRALIAAAALYMPSP